MHTYVIVYEWMDGVTVVWVDGVTPAEAKEALLEDVGYSNDAKYVSVFRDRKGVTPIFCGFHKQVLEAVRAQL